MIGYIMLQIVGVFIFLVWTIILIEQLFKKCFDTEIFILLIITIFLLSIVVIPNHLNGLLEYIGFSRPLDAFLVIASIGSLLLAGKIYLKYVELNKNTTKIVQNLAIKEFDDEIKKN